ncbi:MAG: DUF4127 family protein [Cellvibrionales bacterium]|nr:DUF4127 family protein [Cellvibrionales bacterium]
MQNKKLLIIPIDDRPVVCAQLQDLAALADWQAILPPHNLLGHMRKTADTNSLAEWLFARCDAADGFVLSLDSLIYGGLIASRISTDSIATLDKRSQIISRLREHVGSKPIYAFLSNMRIANSNVNEEEKPYWQDYGTLIWQWSYYSDKHAMCSQADDLYRAHAAKTQIPEHIRTDYLHTRKRNLALTNSVIDQVLTHQLDRLILPQDDNAPYGFHINEIRRLHTRIAQLQLEDRIKIYSGTDEVAWTLTSRLISKLEGRSARKIYLSWHRGQTAQKIIPFYEDQPISIAVASQINAAGSEITENIENADLVLAIHSPESSQGDWALQKPLQEQSVSCASWIKELADLQKSAKPIAIADLAYANGGDPDFFNMMLERLDMRHIIAYSGWNTASNSLGTVAAQMQLAELDKISQNQLKLLGTRLVDDVFYQAIFRQDLRKQIVNATPPDKTKSKFRQSANQWLIDKGMPFMQIDHVTFPWERSFEIGFECRIDPKQAPINKIKGKLQ